jgi:hypothetical protein
MPGFLLHSYLVSSLVTLMKPSAADIGAVLAVECEETLQWCLCVQDFLPVWTYLQKCVSQG